MQTLNGHFLKLFVPIVLVPLIVATIWSSIITWYLSCEASGYGWSWQGMQAAKEAFEFRGRYVEHRLRYIQTLELRHNELRDYLFEENEAVIILEGNRVVDFVTGSALADMAWMSFSPPNSDKNEELLVHGAHLFFGSHQKISGKTVYFLKEAGQDFFFSLQRQFGGELILYRDLEPVISTWRSIDGSIVLPPASEEIKKALTGNPAAQSIQFRGAVAVPKYRGIAQAAIDENRGGGILPDRYGKGTTNPIAYHTLLSIFDGKDNVIALLDIAAPQAPFIFEFYLMVAGSAILFLILVCISIVVIRRISAFYTRPLTVSALDLHSIVLTLTARHLTVSEGDSIKHSSQPGLLEFNLLEKAISRLKILITSWQKQHDELERSRKQLVQSGKMSALGEMAAGIAHEINNPLAVVTTRARHIQTVLTMNPPKIDNALDFSKTIESNAKRIAAIVKGLKTFSRSGESDPFMSCDVREIVADTLTLCSERFKNHGVEIEVAEIPEGIKFEGRSVQISQVLLNLLNNAFDAIEDMPEKWVRVSFEDSHDHVRLSVTDCGKGIPESIREKIMDPFFTTKPIGKGTGLGLSVTRGIIDEHQGTFALDETSPNTCFVITLPKHRASSDTLQKAG